MLFQAILKSSGVDPETVKAQIVDFGKNLQLKIASMDESLKTIQAGQDAIRHQVELLRQAHAIASEGIQNIADRVDAVTSIEVALNGRDHDA